MPTLTYTVILEPEDDGGYHACCPALGCCHTQGETREEALANVKEAIECCLECMRGEGQAPPPDLLVTAVEVEV